MGKQGKLSLLFKALHSRRVYAAAMLAVILLVVLQPGALAEVIRSFDADITLDRDCTLDIIEDIKMDFEDAQRHGIIRWIPIEYKRHGGNYTLELRVKSVTDEDGNPYTYVTSRMGEYMNIKIGNAKFTMSGVHIYRLHYTVRRAVNFFSDAPEVYWNVTGNETPFPTKSVKARFHPPAGVDMEQVHAACYEGPQGSRQPGHVARGKDSILYSATNLEPSEGLTIVAGLPAGVVVKPSVWQEFLWFAADWWPLFAIPSFVSYLLYIIWWRIGRDEDGGRPVAVEWNPPKDLSPAEVGTLVDESCDMQDIVSTLVDLAVRGYIKISELGDPGAFLFFSNRDFRFTDLKKADNNGSLAKHEKLMLDGLFKRGFDTTLLSEQKHVFYTNITPMKNAIYSSLVDRDLFREDPQTVRNSYLGTGGFLFIFGVLSLVLGQLALAGGLSLSGIIVMCSARAMPARTKKGSEKLREILGFQRYVAITEKRRIAMLAKDDPTIFGRMLPYAMVLGVADKWAESFRDLMTQPPDWYEPWGYGPNYVFYSDNFVHDLGGALNTAGTTFAAGPPPTSSSSGAGGGFSGFDGGFGGGGFSGGGFGGGGTGSW